MTSLRFESGFRALRLFVFALIACLALSGRARAQAPNTPAPNTGSVGGLVSTQTGAVRLAGALVTLSDGSRDIATAVADGEGHYLFADLRPGTYHVKAALDGFDAKTVQVVVTVGKVADA